MGKRIAKQRITFNGSVCTIEYPTINKRLTTDVSKHPDSVRLEAMLHGYTQKYGDAKSGESPAEKHEMVSRIIEAHERGSWDVKDRAFDSGLVIEAVARVKKYPVGKIRAVVEELGEEGPERLKQWRANAAVKAMMLTIQAERAVAQVTDDDEEIEI